MSEAPSGLRSTHFAHAGHAEAYRDLQLPRMFEPWARVLLEVVTPNPGDVVLDVGTGPRTVARQAAVLVGPAGRVIGVDISPALLGVGRPWAAQGGPAPLEQNASSATDIPV